MCLCVLSRFSHVWLFVTTWTVAHEAPLSMGFSRKEYWNGLPCLPPGDLPSPGIEPTSLMSPAWAGEFIGRWVPPGPICRFQNYPLLPIMWANSLKYLSIQYPSIYTYPIGSVSLENIDHHTKQNRNPTMSSMFAHQCVWTTCKCKLVNTH